MEAFSPVLSWRISFRVREIPLSKEEKKETWQCRAMTKKEAKTVSAEKLEYVSGFHQRIDTQ